MMYHRTIGSVQDADGLYSRLILHHVKCVKRTSQPSLHVKILRGQEIDKRRAFSRSMQTGGQSEVAVPTMLILHEVCTSHYISYNHGTIIAPVDYSYSPWVWYSVCLGFYALRRFWYEVLLTLFCIDFSCCRERVVRRREQTIRKEEFAGDK
jgi:hypothetical protein